MLASLKSQILQQLLYYSNFLSTTAIKNEVKQFQKIQTFYYVHWWGKITVSVSRYFKWQNKGIIQMNHKSKRSSLLSIQKPENKEICILMEQL